MAAPKCSDEEFIRLWQETGGGREMARRLDMNHSKLSERRRRIEAKYGIQLVSANLPHFGQRDGGAKIINKVSEGVVQLEIQNGTVIVFSDAHFQPSVDTTAFRALLTFIRLMKPAAVINNGDAFDGGTISRYPRIGWDNKPSVVDELKAVKRALGMIEEAAGRSAITWPLGNHDSRYETFLAAKVPEFQGIDGFHLKDQFPNWRPCWMTKINNDVVVKHRFKGGVHATHNNTLWAGLTTVTGHLHSLKVTPFTDYHGTRYGVDTGTLADPGSNHDRDYTECNPLNHRSGFVILTFHNGQLLMPEIVSKWDEDYVNFRGTLVHADTGESK